MPLRPRLLRTYSRRPGYLRPLPPRDTWISPPQDRKRLFSSTSGPSSATSSALSASSAVSVPSDDPDFSPPHKRLPQGPGRRPAWARRLRTRGKENRGSSGKENREPAGQENLKPDNGERETRGRGKENREPAGKKKKKKKWSQGKEPRGRTEEPRGSSPSSPCPSPSPPRRSGRGRQGPLCAARRPLLCSTPQWAPPPRRARGPPPPLLLLSSAADSASEFRDSPPPHRRRRPPVRLSSLLLSTTIEGGSGLGDSLPPHRLPQSSPEGCSGQRPSLLGASEEVHELFGPKGWARSWKPEPGLRGSRRVLRSAVRGPCPEQTPPSSQKAPSTPQAALPPVEGEPQPPAPCDSGTCEEPREVPCHPARGLAKRGSSCHRGLDKEFQLVPVVLLDPQEVPRRLKSMKLNKQPDDVQPACLQPGSPVGRQGILENRHKRTKGVPGEGSTCRKACISGFSARRWGRHTRLRPKRHKRQQQPSSSLFGLQTRQKRTRKGALEMSVGVTDNDFSLLNSSYSWARVRASLSFHKKKKVMTDESFCSSILCTPSGKSQLSGYQASLSAGKGQGCSSLASSMVLLAPRDSSSVLELLLTDAEKVFGECNQEGPIAFEECIPLNKMKDCKKIGEGVFGEVFQIDSERGPVALKIIPIEGTEKINGEAQKSFGEILPEVIISKELSLLSEGSVNRTVGFISLYSVHCVQGAYPRYLLEAWDKFHKERGSENDRPDFFGAQQLFMVLEFEFGGKDLECMRSSFSSVAWARSVLHQVTASLAVAEQELHFEHRDLHWGNVLVKSTEVKEVQYVLGGETHSIPTAGIHVNIIDYTLSRLEKDGLTVFCDLSTDQELFQGTGDYQFDIYRQMKEENSNSWTEYHPHSNVLWLHYLADKLLKGMSYKRKASTPALKKIKAQLSKFHREVLTFESAHDVLHHSSLFQ